MRLSVHYTLVLFLPMGILRSNEFKSSPVDIKDEQFPIKVYSTIVDG